MQCDYFDDGRCRSCALMGRPDAEQLAEKQRHAETLLAPFAGIRWHRPVASRAEGYRNKAKMLVGGTADTPTIGIRDVDGHGIDLQDCGICAPGLREAFPAIADFIGLARLTPYELGSRSGELKHVILTESPDGELMLRFVLRSTEALGRIRKQLPALRAALPAARVITVNLLPEHRAVLEGEEEIVLTEASTLPMRVNELTLQLRPQGFFQTNTAIAAALYREARDWVGEIEPASAWDLYSGVGGFALHIAGEREVTGIETSADAVAAAELSRADAALGRVRFAVGDATAFAMGSAETPELVIVNPPRRGVGRELAEWLESSRVGHVLYSSCNAESLARDLAAMPSLAPVRARVFDMFPQTRHFEVMVLLERRGA